MAWRQLGRGLDGAGCPVVLAATTSPFVAAPWLRGRELVSAAAACFQQSASFIAWVWTSQGRVVMPIYVMRDAFLRDAWIVCRWEDIGHVMLVGGGDSLPHWQASYRV